MQTKRINFEWLTVYFHECLSWIKTLYTTNTHNFPNHSLLVLGLCFQSKDFLENTCNHQPMQCLSSASLPDSNVQPKQVLVKNMKKPHTITFLYRGKLNKTIILIQAWEKKNAKHSLSLYSLISKNLLYSLQLPGQASSKNVSQRSLEFDSYLLHQAFLEVMWWEIPRFSTQVCSWV